MHVSQVVKTLTTSSLIFLLSACGGNSHKPSPSYLEEIKNEPNNDMLYVIRDDTFFGGIHTTAVICNNTVFRLNRGEFVECNADKLVNFIAIEHLNSGLLGSRVLEGGISMLPEEYKITYASEPPSREYYFISTKENMDFSKKLSQNEALEIISNGYDRSNDIENTRTVYYNSAILNPYSKYTLTPGIFTVDKKLHDLPQMEEVSSKSITTSVKSATVVIYGQTNLYSAGFWNENSYLGSLNKNSYFDFKTDENALSIYTFFGGKLKKLDLKLKGGEIAYIKYSTSVGWESHNRSLEVSSKAEFDQYKQSAQHFRLKKEAELPEHFHMIEKAGVNLLKGLLEAN